MPPSDTEKDLFLRIMAGGEVQRGKQKSPVPFILPGAFLDAPSKGLGEDFSSDTGGLFTNPDAIADLSLRMHDACGINNVGLPFAMRVESEAYGGECDQGVGPVERYSVTGASQYKTVLKRLNFEKDGRLHVPIECVRILSEKRPHVPVVADISAPLSLATSLMPVDAVLIALRREPEVMEEFLRFLAKNTIKYVRHLIEAGMTALCITDTVATVEILGKECFRRFSLPYVNGITKAAHDKGCPVIVHLCGSLKGVGEELALLRAECLSVDAGASIENLKIALPGKRIMGNADPFLFVNGSLEEIRENIVRALDQFPDILSTSCGLGSGVTLERLTLVKETILKSERVQK